MTAGVLLLNATFEPLGVVKLKRAVGLITAEKVDIIESVDGKSLRGETLVLPFPSVLKLRYHVQIPYRKLRPAVKSKTVLHRDQFRCCYCESTANTMDHILPTSKGGKNTWMNVVAACKRCNLKKGNYLLSELGWEMAYQPTLPAKDRTWLIIGWTEREQWEPYVANYV